MGANKILWGTDVPHTLRRHTYKQLLDTVRCDAPFLSETERDRILGENARAMFFQRATERVTMYQPESFAAALTPDAERHDRLGFVGQRLQDDAETALRALLYRLCDRHIF